MKNEELNKILRKHEMWLDDEEEEEEEEKGERANLNGADFDGSYLPFRYDSLDANIDDSQAIQ